MMKNYIDIVGSVKLEDNNVKHWGFWYEHN